MASNSLLMSIVVRSIICVGVEVTPYKIIIMHSIFVHAFILFVILIKYC